MNKPYPINIIVANSQHLFRKGFISAFGRRKGYNFHHAPTLQSLFNLLTPENKIDMLYVQHDFPELNLIPALPIITAQKPGIKIVVYIGSNDTEYIKLLRSAGIHGIMLPDAEDECILQSVDAVYKDVPYISSNTSNNYATEIKEQTALEKAELSGREMDVLQLKINGKRKPEIATLLGIKRLTVKNHIRALRAKLKKVDLLHIAEPKNGRPRKIKK